MLKKTTHINPFFRENKWVAFILLQLFTLLEGNLFGSEPCNHKNFLMKFKIYL